MTDDFEKMPSLETDTHSFEGRHMAGSDEIDKPVTESAAVRAGRAFAAIVKGDIELELLLARIRGRFRGMKPALNSHAELGWFYCLIWGDIDDDRLC